jgi:membrane-associated protease RseP (regulator of RpoE activity)
MQLQTSLSSSVTVGSAPGGAEIFVDKDFVGNTPSTINISPGRHVITVKKSGFQDWARNMNFSGGAITLNAELTQGSNETTSASANGKNYSVTAVSPNSAENLRSSTQSQNSRVVVEIPPGWIGVNTRHVNDGALVTGVTPGGPAVQAGIQVGDIIHGLNGKIVRDESLEAEIAGLKPGTKIVISYMRSAWSHETLVTVKTRVQ